MKKAYSLVFPLILPVIMLIAAFFLVIRQPVFSTGIVRMVQYSPYIILTTAAILSWRFNKSRVFFLSVVIASCHFLIFVPFRSDENSSSVIIPFIAFLIPVNILLFSLLKDRGVFTVWGLTNAALICIQPAIIFYLHLTDSQAFHYFSDLNPLPFDFKVFQTISQPSAIIFLIVFIIMAVRYISSKTYFDAANLGVVAATFSAFCFFDRGLSVTVFFSFSGLMIISALIQESYSMAFLDELTGLPSRRALKYELMKLSGRYTIAMLDIDFFKKFNDTYGHDVGDQVLKMVAGCMKGVTGGGKAFRYGGEEFTVLFPGASLREAFPHLEQLRETVSKKGFTPRSADRPKNKPKSARSRAGTGKQLFVTISIGVSERSDKYRLPEDVIKAADGALYRAKKKGRNCVSK